MYLELKICHCGYPELNHPFRHPYIPFTIYKNNEENFYNLDAHNYIEYENKVCSVSSCKYSKSIHNSSIVNHNFIEKVVKYRKINFTVPEDAVCCNKDCNVYLLQHKNILTHPFTIKLEIVNKGENDIIEVVHPEDDDIKINTIINS
jgi:hypothetical protein